MKNKIYWILPFVLTILLWNNKALFAQITLIDGGGEGYTSVRSYSGVVKENHYILQLDVNGEDVNISNWSISVRVIEPIRNSEGKVLDPSKVSLRLNSISGKRDVPTIQQVGAIIGKIPLSLSDVPIIPNSQYAIRTGSQHLNNNQLRFSFDIIVEGGSYLEQLKSWQNYVMDMEFTFRSSAVNPSKTNRVIQFQIHPDDTPPITPTYGIQINSNARNGLLEFKTLSDYVNGVSQTYPNGLLVTANTPYVVQVKTNSPSFIDGNNEFPVEYVKLSIKDSNNGAVGGNINLSNNLTDVFRAINTNTQPRLFDITYSMRPSEAQMLGIKSGNNYQTTLTYTLIPQ